jgi:hypothetical protein
MRLSSGRRAPHLIALTRPMRAVLFLWAEVPAYTHINDRSRREPASIRPGCINSV